MLQYRLRSLTAPSGDEVELAPAGLTLVVGANNVGKSRLLRDITSILGHLHEAPVTLTNVETVKSPEQIANDPGILDGIATLIGNDGSPYPRFRSRINGVTQDLMSFTHEWNEGDGLGGALAFMLLHISAGTLGHFASQLPGPEEVEEQSGLIAGLNLYPEIFESLSGLCEEHFGFALTYDRLTGYRSIRVGRPEGEPPKVDEITSTYLESMRALPLLGSQGDGVKSFMGLALQLLLNPVQVFLVDEPEAFLHPPQARALGRWIAETAIRMDRQVIVATHDKDFLVGAIESATDIHVVRVSRDDAGDTRFSELRPNEIAELWDDPVTRYSNLLQGAFHGMTIITEGDADCRFFSATLDAVATAAGKRWMSSNSLFIPSHGKSGILKMVGALARLGASIRVISDFDLLENKRRVRDIVVALGGSWGASFEDPYKILHDHINAGEVSWATLKKQGVHALKGRVRGAAETLLRELGDSGLFPIPVGEMEDLEPTIEAEKVAWVVEMLASGRYQTCEAAHDLVRKVVGLESA